MNWLHDVLQHDPDPAETREWIESLKAVIDSSSAERPAVPVPTCRSARPPNTSTPSPRI